MNDHRHSPSLSSSPRAAGVSISRPHFPWATYTHRASSSSSLQLTGSPALTPQNLPWESGSSPAPPPGSWLSRTMVSGMTPVHIQDDGTRHWTFHAFEWVVKDVSKLKDFLEGEDASAVEEDGTHRPPEDGGFDVLKDSPLLADGKFKLEIARAPLNQDKVERGSLCLFITSLMHGYAHSDYEVSASMMAAIKSQDDRVGERGARSDWVWDAWQADWTFRQESEVWECQLPSLNSLLENSRIASTDSFVICVQIHSPIGPFFPQQPFAYYVPRDLLDGLEALLDNSNTGDVKFICLERSPQPPASPIRSASSPIPSHSSVVSLPVVGPYTTARKRILWAHSDILSRRSEYFATMFTSSFSEASRSPTAANDARRIHTVIVEEADFVTVYWLLKWVYANWLLFREEDDPRGAVDGLGTGWSVKWLSGRGGATEWDWKTLSKAGIIEDSVTVQRDESMSAAASVSSASLSAPGEASGRANERTDNNTPSPTLGSPVSSKSTPRPTINTRTSSAQIPGSSGSSSRRPVVSVKTPVSGQLTSTSHGLISPGTSRNRAAPAPISSQLADVSVPYSQASPRYPVSPSHTRTSGAGRPPSHGSTRAIPVPDPHLHPTQAPSAASALSVYQIAHRYELPGLAQLALEHIMSSITPTSCFPLLLASNAWDELHSLVEDYVVEKFEEVCLCEEFDKCCEEVAAGEWGPEGGRIMAALFRRLRSPGSAPAAAYGRT